MTRFAGCPEHVALWDAINRYAEALGGSRDRMTTARMDAVVNVERALAAVMENHAVPGPAVPGVVLIESPLSSPTEEGFERHLRYLLWCCRHAYEETGKLAVASHLVCPWYMDDRDREERRDGIELRLWLRRVCSEVWFCVDLDWSTGMRAAEAAEKEAGMLGACSTVKLPPGFMAAFEAGKVPPHTPGFTLAMEFLGRRLLASEDENLPSLRALARMLERESIIRTRPDLARYRRMTAELSTLLKRLDPYDLAARNCADAG